MGGGSWSDDTYAYRSSSRASAPVDSYMNTSSGLDPALDPKGVKFRESCDSAEHPESNAIAIFFDVTGSMGDIPALFAKEKLGGLMRMLVAQNTIPDPQILFGAIGDAHSDRVPLQVGQFESDITMDNWLSKIFLEGNGGGQASESYELAFYWAAQHTKIDCFEKRGKKGYLFVIGDENVYPTVKRNQVSDIIGDNIEGMTTKEAIEAAQEKYEVFKICVATSYPDGHLRQWRELLGERAIFLDNPRNVCEFIAAQIASCEGVDTADIGAGLKSAGLDASAVDTVTKALVVGGGGKVAKKGSVTGDLAPVSGAGRSERL